MVKFWTDLMSASGGPTCWDFLRSNQSRMKCLKLDMFGKPVRKFKLILEIGLVLNANFKHRFRPDRHTELSSNLNIRF